MTTALSDVRSGVAYGALGLPLAFVALPLYIVLPNHYATAFGVPLAALGILLLGARLLDAVADPWIGRLSDRWFAHSARRVLGAAAVAAACAAVGFHALFFPAVVGNDALLLWCGIGLAVTYLAYSVLSVVHQSWGARLGGSPAQQARVVAWREGLALAGVLAASVLPSLVGLEATSAVFALALLLGLIWLRGAPRPASIASHTPPLPLGLPFTNPAFRRLLAVFVVNGIASAVPATLVLFFIRDRLQLIAWEPLFLFCYFAAGALSMPLWVRAVPRLGLARLWLVGMLLATAAFVWAATLGAGSFVGYLWVCVASGLALGADLALPGALLAGVIQRAGHSGRSEGAYFGWWNFAIKLNLAIAAGLSLPLLAAFGYTPGSRDAAALDALTWAYCLLPCALKVLACALLWSLWMHSSHGDSR
ncbi:MAG: MFS transporter [Aquincola sp.]|nr:MFS transporter [Aquincola sp.]MDH4288641.1 MFS transporter [Aquincola sp.]MDH5329682.1 MFS transporter [Aquincola sp.]